MAAQLHSPIAKRNSNIIFPINKSTKYNNYEEIIRRRRTLTDRIERLWARRPKFWHYLHGKLRHADI